MKIHQNTVAYFKKMAAAAKTMLERNYWNRRKSGAEDLERQLAARAKAAAQLKQREDNLNSFAKMDTPKVRLESKHPNGCIVHWEPPTKWEPDTYMVLVRESPLEDWRSVASSNITWETRTQVLTKSYLAWGEYKEPYYICVAAVKDGVGRKESETMIYPPDYKMPPLGYDTDGNEIPPLQPRAKQNRTAEPKVKEIKIEPIKVEADAVATAMQPKLDPFAGRHPGPSEETDTPAVGVFATREEEIIHCLRNYVGRRTRKGRPYIGDFREHCVLYPKVKYSEMRRLWKQLNTAPTGEEKWR